MKRSITNSILFLAVSIIISLIITACAITAQQQQTKDYSDVIFNTLAAEFALRQNDKEESAKYYAKALEKSSDVDFIADTIEYSLARGNYTNAIRAGEILFGLDPENETLKKLLPYLYLSTAQSGKAIALLDALEDSELTIAVFSKISAAGLLEFNEMSLKGLREAAEHFSTQAMAQYAYAISANHFKKYEQAIIFADRGLALAPKIDAGYKTKADALKQLGRTHESIDVLHAGLQALPDSIILRLSYAEILYELKRSQEAYDQFVQLHQTMREVPFSVVQSLGTVALELGKVDEALAYFQELENFPGLNFRAIYLQGYTLFQRKEPEDIVEALTILQSVPVNSGTLFGRSQLLIARIYQDQMMIDQAVAQLDQALEQVQDSDEQVNFYIAQGRILDVAERYTEAYAVYSKAIMNFSDNLSLYLLRAYNAAKMNNLAIIENDVKHILSKDANNVDALNLLGYHLADQNIRLNEAKDYLVRAYEISPEDPRIIDSLGWIEFRLKNFEYAEELILQAIEKYSDPEIYGHLVEILRARNQNNEAEKKLNEALQIYPDDKYLNSL